MVTLPSNNPSGYQEKKSFFDGMLTVYGRLAVKEALLHPDSKPYRLHLARTNRKAEVIDEIVVLATNQGAEVCLHSRAELARISRNGKQDQGVAVDLICKGFGDYTRFSSEDKIFELIALEGITNPGNLGMIVRSVCASPLAGMILPRKGCAKLDSLVIKASAGNLFKSSIYWCQPLEECLLYFKNEMACQVIGLSAQASTSIRNLLIKKPTIYVLGNESHGLSAKVAALCDQFVTIPMENQVESLNVSVAASLIAFRSVLTR